MEKKYDSVKSLYITPLQGGKTE